MNKYWIANIYKVARLCRELYWNRKWRTHDSRKELGICVRQEVTTVFLPLSTITLRMNVRKTSVLSDRIWLHKHTFAAEWIVRSRMVLSFMIYPHNIREYRFYNSGIATVFWFDNYYQPLDN